MACKIRLAGAGDCSNILSLIQELADYENLSTGPKLTVDDLIRDGFGENPLFYCFVAEYEDETEKNKYNLVGFAFYYHTYATYTGKSLYLEDLYVKESFRKKGIGSSLWNAIMDEILKNDFSRLHFYVLNWNSNSINFYKKKGAIDTTSSYGWNPHRITRNDMEKLDELNLNDCPVSCKIRLANVNDCDAILSLIKALSKHDVSATNPVRLTVDDLKRDGFGKNPAFYVLVAECSNENGKDQIPEIVGQAFYYYTYSTWTGRAYYLEDLVVKEHYRNKYIGTALWKALIQEAIKNDCCRIDFSAHEASQFYQKRGAKNIQETEGWHFFRITKPDIEKSRQLPSN